MGRKRPTIFTLDLATTTGFAEGPAGCAPRFWSERLAPKGAPQEELFSGLIRHVGLHLKAFPPDIVAVEEPDLFRLKAGVATRQSIEVLFGLSAVAQGVAHRMGVRRISRVAANDVRAFFVGQRKLKREDAKRLTVAECRRRGWEVRNDDEGDACALHAFMSEVVRREGGWDE